MQEIYKVLNLWLKTLMRIASLQQLRGIKTKDIHLAIYHQAIANWQQLPATFEWRPSPRYTANNNVLQAANLEHHYHKQLVSRRSCRHLIKD